MRLIFMYALLVSFTIVVNWPGRANPDTIDMLYQARNIESLNSWHSPFITFMYGLLGPIFGYPGGGLVVQSILMMTWPILLLDKIQCLPISGLRKFGLITLWLILVSLLVVLSGQIVKDSLITALLSAIFFIVFRTGPYLQNIWKANGINVALLILILAIISIRPPNLLIFLFVGIAYIFTVAHDRLPRRWLVVGVLLTILGAGVSTTVNRVLLPTKEQNPEVVLYIFDIAGISTRTNVDLFRKIPDWTPPPSQSPSQCYNGIQADPFMWGNCKDYGVLGVKNISALRNLWWREIIMNPFPYLLHRLEYTGHLVFRTGRITDVVVPPAPLFDYTTNHPIHIQAMDPRMAADIDLWKPTVGFLPVAVIADKWFKSFLGWPITWILFNAAGFAIGARLLRTVGDPRLLIISGIGLANFLFFAAFGPSDDLRYLLPTMLCAMGSGILGAKPTYSWLAEHISRFRS